MTTQVVQVKVRVKEDNKKWEQREVVGEFHVTKFDFSGDIKWLEISGKTLQEKATEIARAYDNAVELRWNWKGSLQGNYVSLS